MPWFKVKLTQTKRFSFYQGIDGLIYYDTTNYALLVYKRYYFMEHNPLMHSIFRTFANSRNVFNG